MKTTLLSAIEEPGFPPAAAGATWLFACARCRRMRARGGAWLTGTSARFEAACRLVASRRAPAELSQELLRLLANYEHERGCSR